MTQITSIEQLEALYQPAMPAAIAKVVTRLTPLYTKWIETARFVIISTVGPEGTDASPRGDDGAVIKIADPATLLLPDWRGNNRLDSLRNIVRDPRVSLMFMIAGCNNVIRINGQATLSTDPKLIGRFDKAGKHPASVIIIKTEEIYFQCAKALMRSALWQPDPDAPKPPTAGEFVRELHEGFDAKAYDDGYANYAKDRMW